MFGSDAVAVLAGRTVWNETNQCLADLSASERDAVLGGTGNAFYKLGL